MSATPGHQNAETIEGSISIVPPPWTKGPEVNAHHNSTSSEDPPQAGHWTPGITATPGHQNAENHVTKTDVSTVTAHNAHQAGHLTAVDRPRTDASGAPADARGCCQNHMGFPISGDTPIAG